MKNIDKEPTYYVSLTEYNEVKRMFLKANNDINKLKKRLAIAVEGLKTIIKEDMYNLDEHRVFIEDKLKQIKGVK